MSRRRCTAAPDARDRYTATTTDAWPPPTTAATPGVSGEPPSAAAGAPAFGPGTIGSMRSTLPARPAGDIRSGAAMRVRHATYTTLDSGATNMRTYVRWTRASCTPTST